MKKFMRIALVFALAGATLMYTGCTKDYSGDISDLNKKVSENASAISALQTQVAAAQTSANDALASAQNALKEAQEAAKAAAAANNDAEVAALTAKVATIEGQIADLEAKVEALDGLEAKLNEVAEQLKKDVDAKVDKALEEIRAEVAALIESVGVTDFKIVYPYGLDIVYGQFNGVFSGLKSATWDGPRAEEVAALEKGSYISSSNVEFLEIQVNPVNADLHDVEFSLQNQDGVAAPLDFGAPYSYEDTKAASGVWYVPFSVGEITKSFVEQEKYSWTQLWWDAEASLVYNEAVRSDYIDVSVSSADKEDFSEEFFTYDAYGYTNLLSQRFLTGEFTFEAEDPEYVYDAFITKCKNTDYEIVKYGIKFDGLTVSYNLDAVNKYFKDNDDALVFKFQFKQLNVNGYIKEQKNNDCVEVTIEKYNAPHYATEHKAEIEDAAKHEAAPARTVNGVYTQSVTIDLAEAAKAWGIEAGSDARTLWEEEFFKNNHTGVVSAAIFYPSDDSTVNIDVNDNVVVSVPLFNSSVSFNSDPNKTTWNGKATLTFAQDYPTFEFDGKDVDPIGKTYYVTIKLADSNDAYIVTVPVQITAPTAESIASWYKWDEITVYQATAAEKTINLNDYLAAKQGFSKTTHGFGVAFNTKKVKVGGADQIWAETQIVGIGDLTLDKITAFVGDGTKISAVEKGSGLPTHYLVETGWDAGTKFTFTGNATTSYEVENLYITAIGGRLYPIENAKVNFVVRNTAPSITLSKALELGSTAGSFEVLTDSSFEPYNTPEAFYGSFTLADADGKAMYISRPSSTDPAYDPIRRDATYGIKTYTLEDGEWIKTNNALINVADQEYKCNYGTDVATDIKSAYGLKVSAAQDLATYYGQQIKVEVTFDGNGNPAALSYVATKANIKSHTTVSFVVTIK